MATTRKPRESAPPTAAGPDGERLLAEKDALIAEKDARITELEGQLTETAAALDDAIEALGSPEPDPEERRLPIERTNFRGAWWCPFCDTSHESQVTSCRCGAHRDGDEAVKT